MISDEKFAASQELVEQAYNYLRDGYEQALDALEEAETENAKLREQMERLVTLLRVDCDIEASWDGLRKFWSIELTEGGCLLRDRVCKGEAENAKLRQQLADVTESMGRIEERCAKLRELMSEVYEDQCDESDRWKYRDRMRELGVEVDE